MARRSTAGRIGGSAGAVVDGALSAEPASSRSRPPAIQADPAAGFSSHVATFSDFEMTAEFWSAEDTNSGLFIRCGSLRIRQLRQLLRDQHQRSARNDADRRHCRCPFAAPLSRKAPGSGAGSMCWPRAASRRKGQRRDAHRHARRETERWRGRFAGGRTDRLGSD